jgi:hypothetical protein
LDGRCSFFEQPFFTEFYEIVGDIVCWSNDVLTLNVENGEPNLIGLLRRDYELSWHEAYELTHELINDRVNDYLLAERRLIPEIDVQLYLGVLRSVICAHLLLIR